MYYEVYADVLFVKNLWMDALLLVVTAWIWDYETRPARIAAASVLGSAGSCFLTVMSARTGGAGYFLGTLILAFAMTGTAYPWREHPCRLFRGVLSVYLEGTALGGMTRYLEQFHPLAGVWFLVLGSLAAGAVLAGELWRKRERRNRLLTCRVTLKHGRTRMEVEALYDTGNSLRDPVSGKPVSIVDTDILRELLDGSETENLPRFVPYRTISQEGILQAYVLDEMELACPDGIRILKKPLLAGMPDKRGRRRMILHRDLLSS